VSRCQLVPVRKELCQPVPGRKEHCQPVPGRKELCQPVPGRKESRKHTLWCIVAQMEEKYYDRCIDIVQLRLEAE